MIKKGKHLIRSHMTLEYDFSGIRIQESLLIPVDWKLSVDLVALEKAGHNKEDSEHQAGITYQKIYYWLDTNMPNIVAADVGEEDDIFIANVSSNIMMYCPGTPTDDLIIQLLHSKISVLAEPNLVVGEIRLKGSDTALQYTYAAAEDGTSSLPATTEEYYTASDTRHKEPWWVRNDGFCFEFICQDANSEDDPYAHIVDPLDEFDVFVKQMDSQLGIIKEPAKIVQVEKWKPRKVE